MESFESEINKSIAALDLVGQRVRDKNYKGKRSFDSSPFDFWILRKGIFYAIECKRTKSRTSYAFSGIRRHQPIELRRIVDEGGRGVFFFNFRNSKSPRLNRLFVMSIQLYEQLVNNGRKSFKFKECVDLLTEISRMRIKSGESNTYGWNLRQLF